MKNLACENIVYSRNVMEYVKTGFVADNSNLKLLFQLPAFAQGAFVHDPASEIYVEAETVTLSPSAEAANVATPVAKDTEFCVVCAQSFPLIRCSAKNAAQIWETTGQDKR